MPQARIAYDPRTNQLLEFRSRVPAFRDGGDTPRAYLERCLATIAEREPRRRVGREEPEAVVGSEVVRRDGQFAPGLRALAQPEFVLYFQPKLDAVSGPLTGPEALIRRRHPPATFRSVRPASRSS